VITSDAAFGIGGKVLIRGSLRLDGPWDTTRRIEALGRGAAGLNTNGFDAIFRSAFADGATSFASERGTFTKSGAGTLVIENAREFTQDLAITGGTVVINGDMGAVGTLTAGISGTLAGAGSLQRATTINGTLAPGYNGAGPLGVGNLTLNNGSTLALDIASPTLFDQVNATGTITLNGTIDLTLNLSFDPADWGDSFLVLNNDGSEATAGTGRFAFAGQRLEEADAFTVGSQAFRISYAGGSGNDVVLYAIPEPSALALLFAAGALLGIRRSRKAA
jgi:autotransporter-associated beta strand protein